MKEFDYIIVGKGLAGSVLALTLLRAEKKILVIDDSSLSSSSRVAAGLFQPMTFKRTLESWNGFNSISFAKEFYNWAENKLETKFFFPRDMFRIFSSYEEQNNWALKASEIEFRHLISEEKNEEAESCLPGFGYGMVHHAGYMDIPKFLQATERFLIANEFIYNSSYDYDKLILNGDGLSYENFSAQSIIFCEGWLIKNNPWFNYIPMKPVKGEVITIDISDKSFQSIISSGLFCIPREEGDYKIGSNYDWKNLNEIPTEKVKSDFKEEIKKILNSEDIFVKSHLAGVRPASNDRRPFIGAHPQFSQLYILNGLGARGVSLAPLMADELKNSLLHQLPISEEIHVNRFQKYFRR